MLILDPFFSRTKSHFFVGLEGRTHHYAVRAPIKGEVPLVSRGRIKGVKDNGGQIRRFRCFRVARALDERKKTGKRTDEWYAPPIRGTVPVFPSNDQPVPYG